MGLFDLGDLAGEIAIPFRTARKVRSQIRSDLLKNLRDLDSDEPVRIIVGHETRHLGNSLERRLRTIESEIANIGRARMMTRPPEEVYQGYLIPDGEKDEIREELEGIIEEINQRNRTSRISEIVMWILIGVFILILAALISGNAPLLRETVRFILP